MALVPMLDLRPPQDDVSVSHAPSNIEAEQALLKWNPLVWRVVKQRGLFVAGRTKTVRGSHAGRRSRRMQRLMAFLRRTVFDRFGRS